MFTNRFDTCDRSKNDLENWNPRPITDSNIKSETILINTYQDCLTNKKKNKPKQANVTKIPFIYLQLKIFNLTIKTWTLPHLHKNQ